jgi:hypothetical protein
MKVFYFWVLYLFNSFLNPSNFTVCGVRYPESSNFTVCGVRYHESSNFTVCGVRYPESSNFTVRGIRYHESSNFTVGGVRYHESLNFTVCGVRYHESSNCVDVKGYLSPRDSHDVISCLGYQDPFHLQPIHFTRELGFIAFFLTDFF